MKFFPLVWAMLWRSKARTWLTFLSIVAAFVLFALLRTMESGFFQGVRLAGDDHLIVTFRQGLTQVLPYAYLEQIKTVDGVLAASPVFPFGGSYQDPKQQVGGAAMDPFAEVETRLFIPREQLKAYQTTRMGALVGKDLAEKYGWKVGDRVPLTIQQHRKDGTQNWEFEIAGLYEYDTQKIGHKIAANFMVIRWDYWNEALRYPDLVLWYLVRISDPKRATEIGFAIDRLFANSRFETKTQPESDFQMKFLRQIGDIGAVFKAILAAVFFTLILVAANSMMQAFRERVPELGVLKTLGFTDAQLAMLVTAEALLLCLGAGLAGLGLSALLAPLMQVSLQGQGGPGLEAATVLAGIGLALALGLLAALLPAWKSARLTVTEALAGTA